MFALRREGDCDSEGEGAGAEELWKSFAMSFLSSLVGGAAVVGVADDEADGVDAIAVDTAGRDSLPLLLAAGTVPKDFTIVSFNVGGGAAGDEEIGAEASSIDPKVTAEP